MTRISQYDCPYLLEHGEHRVLYVKAYNRPWRNFFRKRFYRPCRDCDFTQPVDGKDVD